MSEQIRTFIAIEIPDQIKSRIGYLQKRLREVESQVSWVKPSNIHLTLKFLGDVRRDRIAGIVSAVERACGAVNSFALDAGGVGCFPSPRNPRVLWIGLHGNGDGLEGLHASIETELAAYGFERDTKPFNPHLTIARLRSPKNVRSLVDQMQAIGFDAETMNVREVIAMQSELNPAGSIYTPLARIALQER